MTGQRLEGGRREQAHHDATSGDATSEPGTEDAATVAALRCGDMAALDALYRAHAETIYNYLYRRTGNPQDAADATSTTFYNAWQARARAITVNDTALPWLYRIAINTLNNQRRVSERHDRKRHLQAVPEPDHADAVAGHLDDRRRIAWVNEQLATMPAGYADVFHLVLWEELSYDQAAAVLEIPVGTVRSRMSRIRADLAARQAAQAAASPTPSPTSSSTASRRPNGARHE